MRVLVTGITGFAGPFVAAALRARGDDVHGLVRGGPARVAEAGAGLLGIGVHDGDLEDAAGFARLVADLAPDAIVHLAGFSFVPDGERDPHAAYRVNLGGTLAVLAAVRTHAPRARLVVASSSSVYGAGGTRSLALDEEAPLRPLTVYGASKAAADVAADQWARAYDLDVVRARPFNHTGPGQAPTFVASALARQIAVVEAGKAAVVRIGNMDPVRDFSDVRDVAAGYVALLERGRAGEAYNLCSGEGASVADVLAILRTHARVPVRVHVDPALRRDKDLERLVGSHARVTRDTGWRPRIPLTETLSALLDYWRARV